MAERIERRAFSRPEDGAGVHVEAMIEDGQFFEGIDNVTLVNRSEGGLQLTADPNGLIYVDKVLLVRLFIGGADKQRHLSARIIWLTQEGSRVRLGCEFGDPLIGVPLNF